LSADRDETPRSIAERELIHFTAAGGLVLYVYRLLCWILPADWVPGAAIPYLAALIVFVLSTLREPADIHRGQSVAKAVWDHVGWAAGCALSAATIWSIR
jgi:hypothetical protein